MRKTLPFSYKDNKKRCVLNHLNIAITVKMHSREQSSYVIPMVLLLYTKVSHVSTYFKIGSLTMINDTMNQKQFSLLHTSVLASSTDLLY